ncbi:MAG: hypothetical protein GXO88_04540 [Chlorobi bacterium]|nr:hypothetical protein [Chlorobiota bacterium]
MTKRVHFFYIASMSAVVAGITAYIAYNGLSYYDTGIEDRFYHDAHQALKPSGYLGHAYGIIGTLFMIIGVSIYMMRKRVKFMSRWGLLKHWLEFHIFLCTLGPILVLFHTSFKFGGIVSVSFWSMVAVFASGVIGRFIYIQIPRTVEGRELSLSEVKEMKVDLNSALMSDYKLPADGYKLIVEGLESRKDITAGNAFVRFLKKYFNDRRNLKLVKKIIRKEGINREDGKKILAIVNDEIYINRRIDRLLTMQNLFKYWHVAHLPFAIIMLVIMVIHVGVTLTFGYRWIF